MHKPVGLQGRIGTSTIHGTKHARARACFVAVLSPAGAWVKTEYTVVVPVGGLGLGLGLGEGDGLGLGDGEGDGDGLGLGDGDGDAGGAGDGDGEGDGCTYVPGFGHSTVSLYWPSDA